MGGSLVEVIVAVQREREEETVARLLELTPHGFRQELRDDGTVAFGIYTEAQHADQMREQLQRELEPVDLTLGDVPDDYAERWKEFHRPVTIGRLWIGPPWCAPAPTGLTPVVIEPGQGFGTGAHATTHLMLSMLVQQPTGSFLDLGCGSGVLAIAAARLGHRPVQGWDNDPAAVVSAQENIQRNAPVSVHLSVRDALTDPLPEVDLVAANLSLPVLQRLAERRLQAPRMMVSGLLRSQAETAGHAFDAGGYVVRERRDRDGWAALLLERIEQPVRSVVF